MIPCIIIHVNKILRLILNKIFMRPVCQKLQSSHKRNHRFYNLRIWRDKKVHRLQCSNSGCVSSPLIIHVSCNSCLNPSEICCRYRKRKAKELELKLNKGKAFYKARKGVELEQPKHPKIDRTRVTSLLNVKNYCIATVTKALWHQQRDRN